MPQILVSASGRIVQVSESITRLQDTSVLCLLCVAFSISHANAS